MRRGFRIAAALVTLGVAAVLIAHSRPVRQYALRRAIATLQQQFGIRLEAQDLRYDVLALRVELRELRVSADDRSAAPFFAARRVAAQFPTSIIFGPFAIDALVVDEGRVRVVRRADGTTNLPASRGESEPPQPLRLRSIMARQLRIEVADALTGSTLELPAIDVTVSEDAGRLYLREPGRFTRQQTATRVSEIRGGVAFDGRAVRLSNVTLRTDELDAALSGVVALVVEEPRVDVSVQARADIERLGRWATAAAVPSGVLALRGRVTGPFDALTSDVTFHSPELRYASFEVGTVEGRAIASPGVVRLDRLAARVAGGQVDASAEIPLQEGDGRANLAWSGVDVETLTLMSGVTTTPRPTGRSEGTLTAHGPLGQPHEWVAEGQLHVSGGTTARNRVGVEGTVHVGVKRGEWALATPAQLSVGGIGLGLHVGGRIDFDAPDRSGLGGLVDLPATDIAQAATLLRRVGMLDQELGPIDGVVEGRALLGGRVGSPRAEITAEARTDDIASVSAAIPVHTPAFLHVESDLRTARIRMTLPGLPALADGIVELRAPYAVQAEASAPGVALETVLRGLTALPLAGTISANARAKGTLTRWRDARLELDVEALDATLGALPLRLESPARASVEREVADVQSFEVAAGDTRVSATGRLALTDAAAARADGTALLLTATGSLDQFLGAIAASRIATLPDVTGSGPAALLARVTGSAQNPRISADLELGPGTVQAARLPAVTNLTMRLHSDGTWVDLRELRADWQGATVSAQGRAPVDLRSGAAGVGVVTARLTALTPRVLEPFLEADTLAQLDGSVDATLQVRSPSLALNAVTGELRLDRMELRVNDLPISQREPTRVTIHDGFAEVASWQWEGRGGTAGVNGRVRLADRTAALIAEGRFDLRMLTPFTRDAGVTVAGTVEPRVSITGTLDAPRIDGVMALQNGEMRLQAPRIVASNLDAGIVLTSSKAHITSLAGTVNGGSLSGSGSASYAAPGSVNASVSATVARMALDFPEGLRSELDADLRVDVDAPAGADPAGTISGTITVVRSVYREPIAVAGAVLAALRSRHLAAEAAAAAPTLVDNLALDVRLVTGEANVVVDNNIGRLALAADLRVIGTVAAPALSGRAQLTEGGQLFLGRNRYEISSGTIDFVNPVAIEPELNIVATTRAGSEEIQLTITGSADAPEVNAESLSTPEMGQADVFSLLLTGRRLDAISGDEAEIVGEQALAFLSGDLLGFAGRAVGLDVIRLGSIDQASRRDLTTELDPTARLTFEKAIGRDLDVTFSQALRDADAQTWIVEYRPLRRVEVRFISDDENLRSYAFRHDVAFGGDPLARAPAAARRPRPRQRLGEVSISGARTVPESRLRKALTLEPGDEFDFGLWQRDRDALAELLNAEGFCEARVSARQEGTGPVTLFYAIAEGPRCAIEAQGYELGADILAEIRREWRQSVYDDFLLDQVRAAVGRKLARDGYVRGAVNASLAAQGNRKVLTIRVEPGASVTARRVEFAGVTDALASALDEWAQARPAAVDAAEDPGAFERAATAWLRAHGYARARVTVGPPRVEGVEAVVPVAVDAGPVHTVAGVRVEGAAAFDAKELVEASGLTAGLPFDPAAIEAARDRFQARYRRAGFSGARVAAQSQVDEQAGAVTVTFNVSEGARQVLRDVDVSGNRSIAPDVITRALDLPIGEPVTVDDWLQARRRLFDTGLFRRADVTPEPLARSGATAGETPVRARVVVQEWPTARLRYGFQVAEERPEDEVTGRELVPGVSADVTRQTLFGRAVTLGGAVDFQRRAQSGRAFLSSRTTFGWPIESVFLVERSRERFAAADLVTHLSSASWEQRVRAWRDVQLSYSYRFERNRTFRTTVRPGDDFGFDLTIALAVLNASAAWDTRNDVADPSSGWLVSSSFDWAPAALGTDFRFVKHLAQAYFFRPWRGVVFASAARYGVAAPLDEQDLVLSERYYAGGARTVRGVDEDTLGPRFAFGEPAGGESLLVLNQEVRFPIHRWLRGVAFVDAGNVFAEASGAALGDLATSYGAGLRLATPFALFRVDYGRRFSPSPGESRGGRWTFGIGHAF